LTIERTIRESPYSTCVKRSIYTILNTNYYKSSKNVDMVAEIEDYVIEHGIFIGGMSKEGFFICEDVDDVVLAFWLSMIEDWDLDNPNPSKVFRKKVTDLYILASSIYTDG
jgi:hypothetical protein